MKKFMLNQILTVLMLIVITSGSLNAQYQTHQLYVSGTVSANENMLVTVKGTKTIKGNVVVAEMNGKKTEMRTNENGQAILDFSAIAAGLAAPNVAVIKSFDKKGNLLSTANTTVQPGILQTATGPVLENLPANLSTGEVLTIKGRNLGADAKLFSGDQLQETLSASDREMTVFTNSKTGEQPMYVSTAQGVSEKQYVNIYSLDFNLAKNSISPAENVQAMVMYQSIPVGTQLTFTNRSPQTIKMNIPGAGSAANQSIYTVTKENGTMPVNITGVTKGDFTIALDFNFSNEPVKNNTGSGVFYNEKPGPCDPIIAKIKELAEKLKTKEDELKALEAKKKLFDDAIKGETAEKKRESAQAKRDRAKAKRESAETKREKAKAKDAEVKEAEEKTAELKEKKDAENAKADAAKKKWDEQNEKWKELDKKLKTEKNNAEKKKIKKEKEDIMEKCAELNKEYNKHKEEAARLKRSEDLAELAAKRLRGEAKELRKDADQLDEDAKKLDEEAKKLDEEAGEMEKNGVTDDKEKNKQESNNLKRQIEKLNGEIKKLKDDLAKAITELDDCNRKNPK